jgi:release factor glutamine methyltransferase
MKRPDDWTILKLLQWTTTYFKEHDIESARIDAELLLAFALGLERIDLYLRYDQPLNPDELTRFRTMVKRRVAREPVAYILGAKEFWELEMAVGPEVLIPRPETECLVEAVLDFLKNENGPEAPRFLDLGTGSGAIAMALARSCPTARVVALDRSCAALALADRNRRRHHLEDRVDLVAGDWLAPFSDTRARFDVVVSNPPYIPSGQIDGLQPEIVRYEPRAALDGGPDGLDCLALIIGAAPALLSPGGAVFLEIGHDQFPAVQRLAHESGAYRDVACRPDYSGMDRVACLVRH